MCEKIGAIGLGDRAGVVAELEHTIVVLGENQGCAGWCVAILREHVEHMAEMPLERQCAVFGEVARVAAGIRAVFGPVRINYECLGNQVAHVHWHVIPRHGDDPAPRMPVWGWEADVLRGGMTAAERDELVAKLRRALAADLRG
ncbi:MAG: HIT family protein [Phycisphaerales bacterium]|nr:HIT family protein [Phycisphaerales bacterium]